MATVCWALIKLKSFFPLAVNVTLPQTQSKFSRKRLPLFAYPAYPKCSLRWKLPETYPVALKAFAICYTNKLNEKWSAVEIVIVIVYLHFHRTSYSLYCAELQWRNGILVDEMKCTLDANNKMSDYSCIMKLFTKVCLKHFDSLCTFRLEVMRCACVPTW